MKEEEIRPKKVFDEYLRLAALDADIYFGNSNRPRFLVGRILVSARC